MPYIKGSECIGCGMCLEECKHNAIKINSSYGYARMSIEQFKCMNCKACLKVDCPAEAIKDCRP